MTGTEYIYLSEGDQCVLTAKIDTEGFTWNKGTIVEVLYANRVQDITYVRNLSADKVLMGMSSKALGPMFFLEAMEIYKKSVPLTNTTFRHKFNVDDTVWMMEDNKPKARKIVSLQYTKYRNNKATVTYLCSDGSALHDESNNIYISKDGLLDSLR